MHLDFVGDSMSALFFVTAPASGVCVFVSVSLRLCVCVSASVRTLCVIYLYFRPTTPRDILNFKSTSQRVSRDIFNFRSTNPRDTLNFRSTTPRDILNFRSTSQGVPRDTFNFRSTTPRDAWSILYCFHSTCFCGCGVCIVFKRLHD